MNLLDLFEVQASDIPTYLRRQSGRPDLTMRDIEKQRPKGLQYRVVYPDGRYQDFMNFDAARQAADLGKGRLQNLSEQDLDEGTLEDTRRQGTTNYMMIQKTQNTGQPVTIEFADGAKYQISHPRDKKWFVTQFKKYSLGGLQDMFILAMGEHSKFERLLEKFVDDMAAQKSQKQAQPNPRRDIEESSQKKRLAEREQKVTGRTQRVLDKLRLAQPQARSDLEALAYTLQDVQRKDQEDISRLEKDRNDLEADIRQDLEKTVATLRGKRGVSSDALQKVQASDREQTDLINKIIQIDRQQQQAIDALAGAKAARGTAPRLGQVSVAEPTAKSKTRADRGRADVFQPPDGRQQKTSAKPQAELPLDTAPPRRTGIRPNLTLVPGGGEQPAAGPATPTPTTQASTGGRIRRMAEDINGIKIARDENENIILDETAKDACYHKVRSRYKVWPSAYASGALVQCRKKGAANWGTGGNKK